MSRDDRDDRNDERDEDREEDERDRRRRDDDEDDEAPRRRRHSRHERGVVLFADRGGSIIRTGDEALDEDMPVLNAFRQFLDQERRRARRQMIGLIALFSVLLLGLAGAGGWYVRTLLRRMGDDLETTKIRQEEARLATVSNLQTVATTAISLKKDVIDTRKASVQLREKVQEQSGELGKLLDTITTLEIQNSKLQRSVRMLDTDREEAPYRKELEPAAAPEPDLPELIPRMIAPPTAPDPVAPPPATVSPAGERITTPPPKPVERAPEVKPPRISETMSGVPFRIPLPRD